MSDPLQSRTDYVRSQIELLKKHYPELDDDAELLAGMIEGSTDFDKALDLIIDAHLERRAMKDVALLRSEEMRERAERFGRSADAYKSLAFSLMQTANKTMARRPLATLVVSKGRKKLELDGDFNAQGYMRVKAEPLRSDILAALTAGNDIPGARLVDSDPTLSIRTK
jgi:hypothetical protein